MVVLHSPLRKVKARQVPVSPRLWQWLWSICVYLETPYAFHGALRQDGLLFAFGFRPGLPGEANGSDAFYAAFHASLSMSPC